jgi:hypothetical protein
LIDSTPQARVGTETAFGSVLVPAEEAHLVGRNVEVRAGLLLIIGLVVILVVVSCVGVKSILAFAL